MNRAFAAVPERLPRGRTAVVALVRRQEDGALLYMRRQRRPEDPWSGDVSFPGGFRDPVDQSPEDVARRETEEEVGLALGTALGALSPRRFWMPGPGRMVVLPLVFESPGGALSLDTTEVADARWVAPALASARPHLVVHRLRRLPWPVLAVDLPVGRLWGLTLDLTREYFRRRGRG